MIQVQYLPELVEGVYELAIPRPETIEYLVSAAYAGIFDGTLKVREPKVLVIRDVGKQRDVEEQLKNRLREAVDQLSLVKGRRKLIYVDVSEVVGRPVLQLLELLQVRHGPEILASRLEEKCREWLGVRLDIDAVVLTQSKLYVNEQGHPFAISFENHIAAPYVAPGWTIITRVVPMQ